MIRCTNISENGQQGLFWMGNTQLSVYDITRLINELYEDNKQYKIIIDELKRQNAKLKGRLNDLGVEYYE